jgi:hypothetical protein
VVGGSTTGGSTVGGLVAGDVGGLGVVIILRLTLAQHTLIHTQDKNPIFIKHGLINYLINYADCRIFR